MFGIHTMRSQILVGFVGVMAIVLYLFGVSTYRSVSMLLKNNSSSHIEQTAVQANGRLDALLEQTNALTAQIMTDSYVQQLLLHELKGTPADFAQRQGLLQVISRFQAYTSGVNRVELYAAGGRRLFPMDDQSLVARAVPNEIELADAGKGRLVWLGIDPHDPGSVLALRRINLVDRWYSHGGYLLLSVDRAYFDFSEPHASGKMAEMMILADRDGSSIAWNTKEELPVKELLASSQSTVTANGEEYILVKQRSASTGWTLIILTPVRNVTKGISVLRSALLLSGAAGFVLFIVLSYLLSGLITRPILRLIKAMRSARDGVLKPNTEKSHTMELRELNHTYNQMADNINALIKLVYEKELVQSQTELKALQAQINPHFLYNTLEAFYWSLSEKEEEELADLVIAMSHIFRYVISGSGPGKQEWVTIGDELEHIERYLQIMRMRFGLRLTWSIECPDPVRTLPIPKLLIQPLVENAIVHGIEGKVEGGAVRIAVEEVRAAGVAGADERRLAVTVADNGAGIDGQALRELLLSIRAGTPPASRGTGLGLRNVRRRLELYYNDQAGELSVESKPGAGTTVRFEIPFAGGEGP